MAKIPRQASRQVIPSGRVGGVPQQFFDSGEGIEARGLGALGRGIGNLANVVSEIDRRNKANDDIIASDRAGQERVAAQAELKSFMDENRDPSLWAAEAQRLANLTKDSFSKRTFNDKTRSQRESIFQGGWERSFVVSAQLGESIAKGKQSVVLATNTFINDFASGRPTDISEENLDAALLAELGTKEIAEIKKAEIVADATKVRSKSAVENIKPELIRAIEENGKKEDGIELLNASTKELVDSGILTKAQGAEANKVLGDWMDNYVSGRIQQGKTARKELTQETYQSLMPTLLDPTQAQLRFGLVEQSALSVEDKKKWNSYVKGSYRDAPTQNTPEGHTVSWNAVYDAATLALSPQEAYDVLLTERFGKKQNITDEQFNWAVDKIQNPYPKEMIENIRTTIKSNLEDFNRFFSLDNERNKTVNESLLAWVDELIKQDKVPLFDFKKKMYAMSSQFRVGDDRWYDIGQTIKRGGREWEVVGFDSDGEPLVEEVE